MAGADDRASARLLELWVKREDAAYRDKAQLQIDVIQRASVARGAIISGWDDAAADEPPEPAA
jgi:hypothetical protein